MSFVRKIEPLVLDAINRNKRAAKDNFILVYEVYNRILLEQGVVATSLEDIADKHVEYKLPAYETVMRCRRKLKQERPELFDEKIEKDRLDATADYIKYGLDIDMRFGG